MNDTRKAKKQYRPSLEHLTHGFGSPKEFPNEFLQTLGKPHLDSFNHLINNGLKLIEQNLNPVQIALSNDQILSISLNNLEIKYPVDERLKALYPMQCRQSATTYNAQLTGLLNWRINGAQPIPVMKDFGFIPIMVKNFSTYYKAWVANQWTVGVSIFGLQAYAHIFFNIHKPLNEHSNDLACFDTQLEKIFNQVALEEFYKTYLAQN